MLWSAPWRQVAVSGGLAVPVPSVQHRETVLAALQMMAVMTTAYAALTK
jgi:hypothetical protein